MKRLFIFLPILILLLFLLTSIMLAKIGDDNFKKDKLKTAKTFYQIGQNLRIFQMSFNQRLLAIEIAQNERSQINQPESLSSESIQTTNPKTLGASITVPILMYHYIRVNPNPKDRLGFSLSVTPADFAKQMDYLREHGFNTVSLDELSSALAGRSLLPSRPIIITFDDGYLDFYQNAYPVLKEHNFKATNFVITVLIGAPNYLAWEQIVEMSRNYTVSFQSHTVTHPVLTKLSDANILREIIESRNVLQRYTSQTVNWLAYPYGSVNQRVANLVNQAGYQGALSTRSGAVYDSDRLFTLPRVRINGGETLAGFASKLPWSN